MARVDISLGGRQYPIACDDGQENRVREIAAYIDGKISLIGAVPAVTDTHLMVMASLMLGDELFEAQARLAGGAAAPADSAPLAEAVGRIAGRIEAIATRLEHA
ncbi:MAG: cell division protein ZapA [Alphaproteobacteria bacterium]